MNKLPCLLLALCLASPGLHAADPKPEPGFWEKLRMKIELLTQQRKLATSTTAVGGVRGAPVEVNDIYWKGETKADDIAAEELARFNEAMALAEAGKKEEAKLAFAAFSKNHPRSALRESADQALAHLMTSP